jgi:hypothetical protein
MNCKFFVGQKVVLVDDDWSNWTRVSGWRPILESGRVKLPVKGVVYTVRSIGIHEVLDLPVMLLREIVNPVILYCDASPAEPPFGCRRFRPLVETETDISIFTKMLKPSHQLVD